MSVPVCHQAAWPQEGTQRCIRCLEEIKTAELRGGIVIEEEFPFGAIVFVGGLSHAFLCELHPDNKVQA